MTRVNDLGTPLELGHGIGGHLRYAAGVTPALDLGEGCPGVRSRLVSQRLVRCMIAALYVGLLAGYGDWVAASGYQPPPSLTRVL